jgi:ABC-type Fe3+-hydroxamate transport system substrate-binding protein
MRILVCGSRYFGYTSGSNYTRKDHSVFSEAIDFVESYGPTVIIEGNGTGGDEVGKMTSLVLSIPCKTFSAGLGECSISSGPARNKQMLEVGKPDLVIAFKREDNTSNMIKQAEKAGVPVVRYFEGRDKSDYLNNG